MCVNFYVNGICSDINFYEIHNDFWDNQFYQIVNYVNKKDKPDNS